MHVYAIVPFWCRWCKEHGLPADKELAPAILRANLVLELQPQGGTEALSRLSLKADQASQLIKPKSKAPKTHLNSGRARPKRGEAYGRAADNDVGDALLETLQSHRDQRCVLGSLCRTHAAEMEAAKAVVEALKRDPTKHPTANVSHDDDQPGLFATTRNRGDCGTGNCLDCAAGGSKDSPPALCQPADACAKLPLSHQNCDDILTSIQVADRASSGNGAVVPLSHGQYAVIRSDPESFECNYANLSGVSYVSLRLHQEREGEPSQLELPCTCSVYQKTPSTCGGRSLVGGAKTCLCGVMVLLARILAAPIDDIKRTAAAHLHAVVAHEREAAKPKARHSVKKQSAHDVLVQRLLDSNDFFLEDIFQDRTFFKTISAATKHLEAAVSAGADPQALAFAPHFPTNLEPLPGKSGTPECDGCQLDSRGSFAKLHPVPRDTRHSSCAAWTYVGEVVRQAEVSLYTCSNKEHRCADGSDLRVFGPDGVAWARRTGLFGVCRKWYFSLLLLYKANELCFKRHMIPRRAMAQIVGEAHTFMRLHAPSAPLPNEDTAVEKLFDCWFMFMVLQRINRPRWATCRECGNMPQTLCGDGCYKMLCALNRRSARRQVQFLKKGSVHPCQKCNDPLGTCGGQSITLPCLHKFCFECVDVREPLTDGTAVLSCPTCDQIILLSEELQARVEQHLPLWTERELFNHCRRAIFQKGVQGEDPYAGEIRIPMHRLPPVFQDAETYASQKLYNTSALKGAANALDFDADLQPDVESDSSDAEAADESGQAEVKVSPGSAAPLTAEDVKSKKRPTTAALQGLARCIFDGLDVQKLRSNPCPYTTDELNAVLASCGLTKKAIESKAFTPAKKVKWLLQAWSSLIKGESDCHMFVQAMRGTGGVVTINCPHGVVIMHIYMPTQESVRDYDDALRSLVVEPGVFIVDDACGLSAFRQGVRPFCSPTICGLARLGWAGLG